MKQRQVPMPAGTFALCDACGHEPRWIVTQGRSARETMQTRIPAVRHSLECSRCSRSTGLCPSRTAAESAWGRLYGPHSPSRLLSDGSPSLGWFPDPGEPVGAWLLGDIASSPRNVIVISTPSNSPDSFFHQLARSAAAGGHPAQMQLLEAPHAV